MVAVLMRIVVNDLIWAVVSLKSKAAPTFCGHAISWDFYSGTLPDFCLTPCVCCDVHHRIGKRLRTRLCSVSCVTQWRLKSFWVCSNTDVSGRQPACAEIYASRRTVKNPRLQTPIRQTFAFMKKWRSICPAPVIGLVLSCWLVRSIWAAVTHEQLCS